MTTLPEGKWTVEERSTLEVSIKHLGVATVRGRFGQVEGELDVGPRGELSAELWVATASLTTGDDKRDAFLVSPDFLDASAHPRATFRVRGGHVGEDNSKVKGTLTVAGTAAEVEAGVEIDSNDAGPLLRVETVVDRHVYGLRFPQVAGAGDSVVAKSVRITGALALRPR